MKTTVEPTVSVVMILLPLIGIPGSPQFTTATKIKVISSKLFFTINVSAFITVLGIHGK